MTSIKVLMKDGTVQDFPHESRPGGSYTNHITYEGAFAIIRDPWDNDVAIPAADIKEVRVNRR